MITLIWWKLEVAWKHQEIWLQNLIHLCWWEPLDTINRLPAWVCVTYCMCVHLNLHVCMCILFKPYSVTFKPITLTSDNLAAMSASLLSFCFTCLFYSTSHCLSLIPYLLLSGNSIHKPVYSFIPLSHCFPPRTNHCFSFWCPFHSICSSLHHLPPPHLSFTLYNLLTVNNLASWSLFKWT